MKLNFKHFSAHWLVLALLPFAFSSCEKYNQVDNSATVKLPYVLFIGGYNGVVQKTNDALSYNSLFNTDNSITRQIIVADSNIIYLKQHVYVSTDDGKMFVRSNGLNKIPYINELRKYYLPNTGLYDKGEKRVYICANTDADLIGNGDLYVSTDAGKTFNVESNWAGGAGNPTSITQLKNGDLYIIEDSGKIWRKQGSNPWTPVAQNTTNRLGRDTTNWYISHKGDTLLVIDYNGRQGVYYSLNGIDWTKCTGMPTKKKILFGNQAFDNNQFYIGYDSAGLYRLNGTAFESTGVGLPWYAKVGFVEGKSVTYRTDFKRNYLFAATDAGLYISETDGLDWRLIYNGSYSTLQ